MDTHAGFLIRVKFTDFLPRG